MEISNKRELKHIAFNKDFMKLYRDYTKEPISFSLAIKLYHQIIP